MTLFIFKNTCMIEVKSHSFKFKWLLLNTWQCQLTTRDVLCASSDRKRLLLMSLWWRSEMGIRAKTEFLLFYGGHSEWKLISPLVCDSEGHRTQDTSVVPFGATALHVWLRLSVFTHHCLLSKVQISEQGEQMNFSMKTMTWNVTKQLIDGVGFCSSCFCLMFEWIFKAWLSA